MSFSSSGQVEYFGTGNITALNSDVTVLIPTSASISFQITGTWAATLSFEATSDGTTWYPISAAIVATGALVSSTLVNDIFGIAIGGFLQVRIRASAYTSGTAVVSWTADNNPNPSFSTRIINGGTDGAVIGNVLDSLKVIPGTTRDNTASGTIAALNANVIIATNGSNTAMVRISGTWNATLTFQGTVNGTNYVQCNAVDVPNKSGITNTAVVSGTYAVECGGFSAIRIIATAYTSGTATIQINGSAGLQLVTVYQPTASAFNATVRLNDGNGSSIIQGQQPMSSSLPVTIASNQTTLPVTDVINVAGVYGALSVTTTAAELKVGGSVLASRKNATILNNGVLPIYWGYSNAVTTSTGTPIAAGQFFSWDIGPSVSIWLITSVGSINTRITEAS